MGRLRFLPPTFRGQVVLVVALGLLYLVGSAIYIRGGGFNSGARREASRTQWPEDGQGGDGTLEDPKRILLVSAMFPLKKAKHSATEYDSWLRNYLGSITTDVYLFTTPAMEASVRALRGENLRLTIDTTYSSPFEIPALKGKERQYRKIHAKDREKSIHSIELYAVWNAKPFFLNAAVRTLEKEGVTYDYAFWNDAGSFREDHFYRQWPSPSKVQEVWKEGSSLTGIDEQNLIFFPMWSAPHPSYAHWTEDMGPVDADISEGSFFGGHPKAIDWWTRTFYAYHDHYLSSGIFVGKDQTLINALFLLFPERLITVWYNDPDAPAHLGKGNGSCLGQCSNEWFYYQFWLSNMQTKELMRELWIYNASKWRIWGWWRSKDTRSCEDTRVVPMKDVLKRSFGERWRPPLRQVEIPER